VNLLENSGYLPAITPKNETFFYHLYHSHFFSDQKKYQKEFYKNGQIEKEGCILNNSKIDY
jgi:hypothetical protein